MKLKRLLATICVAGVMAGAMGINVSANSGFDLNNIDSSGNIVSDAGTGDTGDTGDGQSDDGGLLGGTGNNNYSETNEAVRSNLDASVNITEEDMNKAGQIVAPVVNTIRWCIAIILVLFPALLILNTMIDLLCILISPFRRAVEMVNGGAGGAAGGMPGMGMGMGMSHGMGMGMGMPGAAGGTGAADDGSIFSMVAKWASAEAAAAILASKPTGGGGMPGMPGMGMGMPQQGAVKTKSVLVQYFKKRTVALVVAGVCIVCFACTAFTDLGLKLGTWIVDRVGGIG